MGFYTWVGFWLEKNKRVSIFGKRTAMHTPEGHIRVNNISCYNFPRCRWLNANLIIHRVEVETSLLQVQKKYHFCPLHLVMKTVYLFSIPNGINQLGAGLAWLFPESRVLAHR